MIDIYKKELSKSTNIPISTTKITREFMSILPTILLLFNKNQLRAVSHKFVAKLILLSNSCLLMTQKYTVLK